MATPDIPEDSILPIYISMKLLHCGICSKQYVDPKCLPCQHLFCCHCLNDYVKNADTIRCPSCNQIWDVPDGGVKAFPQNSSFNDLLEVVGSGEEVGVPTKCQTCNKNVPSHICVDCDSTMCEDCSDCHRKLPIFKEHRIIPLQEIERAREQAHKHSLIRQQGICKTHGKIIDKFCNTCEIPICEKCMDFKHKLHDCVTILMVKEECLKSLSCCLTQMKTKLEKYEKRTKRSEISLNDLENLYKREVEAVESQAKDIIEKVKQEKEELIRALAKGFDLEKDIIKQDINVSNSKQQVINRAINDVDVLLKYGTPAQIALSKPLVQHSTADFESSPIFKHSVINEITTFVPIEVLPKSHLGSIEHAFPHTDNIELKLDMSDTIREGDEVYGTMNIRNQRKDQMVLMHRYVEATLEYPNGDATGIEIESIEGDVLNFSMHCKGEGTHHVSIKFHKRDVQGSPFSFVAKPRLKNTSIIGNEDVDRNDDTELSLPCGVAVDKTGKVFIADGLRRIQRHNCDKRKRRVIIDAKADPCPQYVAVSKKDEYFVTDLVCVTVYNSRGKQVKSFGKGYLEIPMGIAINNSKGLVYVADKGKRTLSVFAVGGESRDLPKENVPEEFELVNPNGVAVDSEGNVIVSDRDKHRIQVYDALCKPLFAFGCEGNEPGHLKDPEGVAVDKHRNIYVCDYSNNRVQKFDNQGRFVCCLNDNVPLDGPRCVAVDDKCNRIFVTAGDFVYVFE
ncbi:tripartite motif-containing protein 2-like [Ptychodera flava]|uniref:tripartite motif-containing protein 2-like n=1 Tax=Ptychodera flava TaxID=63121 RepID=UPI00396A5FCB